MDHFKGWTTVVAWITTGLALLFFHAVWPGLNGWARENQHLSGWMQFIGAVLAIWGAYHFGERQAKAARTLVREQQLVEAGRLMQSIRKILVHTQFELKKFREAWQFNGHALFTTMECQRMKAVIGHIDLVKCNSPLLVGYLLQMPQLLEEAIQHQQHVSTNLNAVYMTGRDEPGFRDKVFTREMNQTAAIENFIGLAIEQAEAEEDSINEMRRHL